MSPPKSRLALIKHELKNHLPFTLIGVVLSIIALAVFQLFFIKIAHFNARSSFENLFHFAHFMHIFMSAIATAALYFRQERHVGKTIFVGFLSTLLFCVVSDMLLPFVGGNLLGMNVHLHLCLLDETLGVLLANALGIWIGVILAIKLGKISYFSHGAHVFISSLASLLYLVSFGPEAWTGFLFGLFLVTTIAVVIPCCSSDIILPVACISGMHGHEHEDEHTQHQHD